MKIIMLDDFRLILLNKLIHAWNKSKHKDTTKNIFSTCVCIRLWQIILSHEKLSRKYQVKFKDKSKITNAFPEAVQNTLNINQKTKVFILLCTISYPLDTKNNENCIFKKEAQGRLTLLINACSNRRQRKGRIKVHTKFIPIIHLLTRNTFGDCS